MTGPLETAYDAEINPLMVRIIAICDKHNLPMFCTFKLDGTLACTTACVPQVNDVAEGDRTAYAEWRQAARRHAADMGLR